ncbi:hypothetical protein DITRI_Ditri05aG0001100 [Diplodiscus trichospermus]
MSIVSAYSGLLQTPKGGKDSLINAVFEHLGLLSWDRGENCRDGANEDPLLQQTVNPEKKRTGNIGSKKYWKNDDSQSCEVVVVFVCISQLLLVDLDYDAASLRSHFAVYMYISSSAECYGSFSRGQEQWAQCDDCSKWRRLPIDFLLPPKGTCSDNIWDSRRCNVFLWFCVVRSLLRRLTQRNYRLFLKWVEVGHYAVGDLKKPKIVGSPQLALECEPSGLDALASAAVLGDKKGDVGESSIGATTKHPRHCLGCTCIVCIQPPSGKGKHKTTCTCNVCMTVKRRFKPLMLRKKKRQSEHEAEILQKDNEHKDESELKETRPDHSEKEARQSRIQDEVAETSSGQIDLNCHPHVKICNLKNQD